MPTVQSIVLEEFRAGHIPVTGPARDLCNRVCPALDLLVQRADLLGTRQSWDRVYARLAQFLVELFLTVRPSGADRMAIRNALFRIARRVFVELLGVVPRLRGAVHAGPPEFALPLIDLDPVKLAEVLAWLFPPPRIVAPTF